jgi:hypothetical protein
VSRERAEMLIIVAAGFLMGALIVMVWIDLTGGY